MILEITFPAILMTMLTEPLLIDLGHYDIKIYWKSSFAYDWPLNKKYMTFGSLGGLKARNSQRSLLTWSNSSRNFACGDLWEHKRCWGNVGKENWGGPSSDCFEAHLLPQLTITISCLFAPTQLMNTFPPH